MEYLTLQSTHPKTLQDNNKVKLDYLGDLPSLNLKNLFQFKN